VQRARRRGIEEIVMRSALSALFLVTLSACADETLVAPRPPAADAAADADASDASRADAGTLGVRIEGAEVVLEWGAPSGGPYTRTRVLRRLGGAPSGPRDPSADVVVELSQEASARHPLADLLPSTPMTPRTYEYAAWACTEDGLECASPRQAQLAPSLLACLRGGGYVIYFRHSAATVCADRTDLGTAAATAVPDWWKSCDKSCGTATARQLDANGVAEATTVGAALRGAGVPFGRVLSSEFCRGVETAQLMNLGAPTETKQELTYFVYDEANRCAKTFALLAEVPAKGTNTALVGQSGNVCPPLSELAWSQAAVYKAAPTPVLVATVLANGWSQALQ
jgi:phosphohistidine phosphatase SixA